MAEYKFRALMRDGTVTRGKIESKSKHDIVLKLKGAKLQPILIKKVKLRVIKVNKSNIDKIIKKNELSAFSSVNTWTSNIKKNFRFEMFKKVKASDVIAFTNNLYILKKAKFTNIQSLEVLFEGTENKAFKDIIENILIAVQNGEKLYIAMENYSRVFPLMYINFVKVGEEAGSLEQALLHARDYLEGSIRLKKQVNAVVVPRLLQFILIIVLIVGGVIFGVPLMQNIFDMFDSNAEVNKITMIAFDVVNWCLKYWYIFVVIILGLIAGFIAYISNPLGRYNYDKFIMKFPVIGKLLTNITISKFFEAMLLNLRNGMRIQESLEVSKGVTSNYYFLSIVEVAKNNSIIGESWITPFEETKVFNAMTTEMISIGMKTDLTEMMSKINVYLKDEINESMNRFSKWLPEVSYAIVGVAMIVFVLVIMVPMLQIYMGGFIEF